MDNPKDEELLLEMKDNRFLVNQSQDYCFDQNINQIMENINSEDISVVQLNFILLKNFITEHQQYFKENTDLLQDILLNIIDLDPDIVSSNEKTFKTFAKIVTKAIKLLLKAEINPPITDFVYNFSEYTDIIYVYPKFIHTSMQINPDLFLNVVDKIIEIVVNGNCSLENFVQYIKIFNLFFISSNNKNSFTSDLSSLNEALKSYIAEMDNDDILSIKLLHTLTTIPESTYLYSSLITSDLLLTIYYKVCDFTVNDLVHCLFLLLYNYLVFHEWRIDDFVGKLLSLLTPQQYINAFYMVTDAEQLENMLGIFSYQIKNDNDFLTLEELNNDSLGFMESIKMHIISQSLSTKIMFLRFYSEIINARQFYFIDETILHIIGEMLESEHISIISLAINIIKPLLNANSKEIFEPIIIYLESSLCFLEEEVEYNDKHIEINSLKEEIYNILSQFK